MGQLVPLRQVSWQGTSLPGVLCGTHPVAVARRQPLPVTRPARPQDSQPSVGTAHPAFLAGDLGARVGPRARDRPLAAPPRVLTWWGNGAQGGVRSLGVKLACETPRAFPESDRDQPFRFTRSTELFGFQHLGRVHRVAGPAGP